MESVPLIRIQELKELFVTTYQGSQTKAIHEAFQKLFKISFSSSNQFLGLCETILETEGKNKGLCMSVSNFIKVLTKKCVNQKLIDECGPKNFINRIEHIFDNSKISPLFKENIAISFIKAALHFRLNFEKLIEKILYLYNVKEPQIAVLLSRAYLLCDQCLNSKLQGLYYKKILHVESKYLLEEIACYVNLIGQESVLNYDDNVFQVQSRITEVLKNLHSSLVSLPFQKFESSIFVCLQGEDIIKVIQSLPLFRKSQKIMILFRELMQKIIENLFRMRRIQKLPKLMKSISQILHDQWTLYQEILQKKISNIITSENNHLETSLQTQQELSLIALLTSGFSSHIIMIIDDHIDIWNLFIAPLYEMKFSILNKNQLDVKQAFLLLEDCTFIMKSECMEVAFNKMIKSILQNYQFVSSKVITEINEVLLCHVDSNDQTKLLMLVNLITFQASYFLTEDSILLKVQNFLKFNKKQLFSSQNSEVYFQSLLLLYHYLDDIFCQYLETDIFYMIAQNFILQKKDQKNSNNFNPLLSFNSEIEKLILITFFSVGFTEKQIQKPSQIIINYLSQTFDHDCLNIYIHLIKNYNIEDRITLQVFDKAFESIYSSVFTHQMNLQTMYEEASSFMQFLVVFFDLEIYKHLFESTLSRVLPIFQHMISNQQQFQDDFFIIIKNFVIHLEYVPQTYLKWMSNIFNHRLMQTEESFKSLSMVLQNLSPSKYNSDNLKYELFVNCISLNLIEILVSSNLQFAQKTNQMIQIYQLVNSSNSRSFFSNETKKSYSKRQICGLLCLHQLIHFHAEYLTKKILHHILSFILTKVIDDQHRNRQDQIKGSAFSFEKGKYQLILILLFRRRLSEVNQILIQMGMEKKVYNAIYMRENRYLLEYDTPLFIKQQIWIIRKLIRHDKLQMTYANTSFLAIFQKFSILFEMKIKQRGKCSLVDIQSDDSDQQDFENQSQLRLDYKEMTRLVLSFPLPQQWRQIDELKEMKQFILELRSNLGSMQWVEKLYQKCLTQNQKRVMEELMTNLENVGGKYRQIIKVDKSTFSNDLKIQIK